MDTTDRAFQALQTLIAEADVSLHMPRRGLALTDDADNHIGECPITESWEEYATRLVRWADARIESVTQERDEWIRRALETQSALERAEEYSSDPADLPAWRDQPWPRPRAGAVHAEVIEGAPH